MGGKLKSSEVEIRLMEGVTFPAHQLFSKFRVHLPSCSFSTFSSHLTCLCLPVTLPPGRGCYRDQPRNRA